MKVIVFIVVFVIILILGIVLISNAIKSNDVYHEDIPLEEDTQKMNENKGKFKKLDNVTDYYSVKACLGKYIVASYSMFENQDEINDNNLYDILDEKYISYKGISKQNIREKLNSISQSDFCINSIFALNNYNGIILYWIDYTIRDLKTNINTESKIIMVVDRNNMSYSVILEDFLNDNNLANVKENDTIDIEIPVKIEQNNNNYFGNLAFTYDEYAEDLFKQFRTDLIYNVERAYSNLDESFKKEKYPTIESFKDFISENYRDIYIMKYGTYSNVIDNNNVKYRCIDSTGKYSITFNLSAPMEYTYIFDVK